MRSCGELVASLQAHLPPREGESQTENTESTPCGCTCMYAQHLCGRAYAHSSTKSVTDVFLGEGKLRERRNTME